MQQGITKKKVWKKGLCLLLAFAVLIGLIPAGAVEGVGTVEQAEASYIGIVPAGTDLTGHVTVLDWEFRDAADVPGTAMGHGSTRSFWFSWEVSLPAGQMIQAGDSFRFERPITATMPGEGVNFVFNNSSWANFTDGAGQVIGQWRIYNNHIEVAFNEHAAGSVNIGGAFSTGLSIFCSVTVTAEVSRDVTFGGVTKPHTFLPRPVAGVLLGTQGKGWHSGSDIRLRWELGPHRTSTRELSGAYAGTTDPALWGTVHTPINLIVEDELNGRFGSAAFDPGIRYPVSLDPSHPHFGQASTAGWWFGGSGWMTRIFPLADEPYADFRARLEPWQWGVWPAPLSLAPADAIPIDDPLRQTFVLNLGTVGVDGRRYSDVGIWPEGAISEAVRTNRILDTPEERQAMRDWLLAVYGDDNVVGGRVVDIIITIWEYFPPVVQDTPIRNYMRVIRDGVPHYSFANGRLSGLGGTAVAVPADSARLWLADDDTGAAIPGVNFQLQLLQSGTWVDVTTAGTNNGIFTTGTDGSFTTPPLGNGTFRFVQQDVSNTAFFTLTNPAHTLFDATLARPVSPEFTLTGGSAEGATVNVYNTRDRRTVTFVSGDTARGTVTADSASVPHALTVGGAHTISYTALQGHQTAHWTSNQHTGTFSTAQIRNLSITADTVFTKVFSAILFNVSYESGTGQGGPHPVTVPFGDTHNLLSNTVTLFTKDGHTFAGWRIGTNDYAVGAPITISGDVTVVARWTPNPHTVTYQAGTGQGADYPVSVVFGETHNLLSNTTTLFTKDGHTFAGWTIGTNDHAVGAQITIDGNVTVVARWTPNPHTVTYQSGTGQGAAHPVNVVFGDTHNLLSNTTTLFTKDGHTFAGWRIGTTDHNAGDTITISGDVTVVARWTADPRTVTYQSGMGQGTDHPVTVSFNDTHNLLSNTTTLFTKDGHTFAGWTIESNDYAVGTQITVTDHMTVVARWTPNPHTVTYESGTGQGADHPVSVVFGETHNLLSNTTTLFTKDGHTFAGWTIGTNDYAVGASITISGDVTVVARWTADPRTVTYQAGTGQGADHPVTVSFNDMHNLLSNTTTLFTKEGHTFAGWTIGTNDYAVGAQITVTDHVTVVARWTPNPHTVTYEIGVPLGDGVVGAPHIVNVVFGEQHALLSNTVTGFVNVGHSFAGWTINGVEYAVGANITIDGDVTAIARWTLDRTVTFRFRDNNALDHEVVVPIDFDQPIDPAVIADIMDQSGVDYGEGTQGFAFWGWFTDQELAASGRTLPSTSTNINAGQRRPALGTMGFCYRYGFTISETLFTQYSVSNNITLYAVWSLWGDVNDDDRVTFEDATLIQFYMALFPNIHLVRPAGDVTRTGSLTFEDATLIQFYVALFPNIYLGRPQNP